MIEDYSSLYRDFMKAELLSIAESLDLDTSSETTSKVLVKRIMQNLIDEGVPEIEECSDLMYQFLVAAEVIDADGNLIEGETIEEADAVAEETSESEAENVPPCYGFEDDRDPACEKCKVQIACRKLRIRQRPPCFGKLFEVNDENCKVCIEAPFCKQVLEEMRKALSGTTTVGKKGL